MPIADFKDYVTKLNGEMARIPPSEEESALVLVMQRIIIVEDGRDDQITRITVHTVAGINIIKL